MSSSLSGFGGAWPVAPPSAAPDLRTNSLMLRISLHVEPAGHVARLTPATPPRPRPSPRRASCAGRGRAPAASRACPCSGDRRGSPGATCARGLLVVDVLELDEGAVAGGEEAGRRPSGRRRRCRSSARCRPTAACPSLVRNGPRGADPDGPVEPGATLQLDRRVELQVGALDRLAEGLVEQVLDVLLVVAAAAGGERQRGEEQEQRSATAHAAQSSWRHRNSTQFRTLDDQMGT